MEIRKSQSDLGLQITFNPLYNKENLGGRTSHLTQQLSLEKELNKILSNQDLCLLFRDWLKQQKCEENINFWVDVELLKQHDDIPFNTKLDEIYEKYFSANAQYPLNIDDELKRELDSRMEHFRQKRNQAQNSDLNSQIHEFGIMVVIEEILRSVLGLLENGCTARFLSSDLYKKWKESEENQPKGGLNGLKKWAGSLRRQRALSNSSDRLRFDRLWKFKEMETHGTSSNSKTKVKEITEDG
mmetsp:Transcript_14300/g.19930  ORF Transcript_14300/g.19930 Transcript_14300/m.19930 type:complete len:242 (-) Transcript_14300:39-764(-)